MEQQQQDLWNSINCKAVDSSLLTDYCSYTKSSLQKYKTTDFTPADMEKVKERSITYLGRHELGALFNACDEQKNHFPHVAIQKGDLPVLTWLMNQPYIYYPINADCKGPIELCIDQISPKNNISSEKKEIAHKMLDLLTANYTNHQQAVDTETGNTFTHIALIEGNADALHELIQKNYVSCAENKAGLTPLALALKIYVQFILPAQGKHKKPAIFDDYCRCIIMLSNYQKKKIL